MSNISGIESRIKQALYGIEQKTDSTPLRCEFPIRQGLQDPPTYIVEILLCEFLGFEWSIEDKSAWVVSLEYDGVNFTISDWKRSTWSIRSFDDTIETQNTAEAFENKLQAAGTILNRLLQPELRKRVDNSEFYIKNSFYPLRRQYEYFRQVLNDELTDSSTSEIDGHLVSDDLTNSENAHWISSFIGRMIRSEQVVSHNACAMVAFFFSYTEFLFDVLFALDEDRSMSYADFRKLTWAERFKEVLPVSDDNTLNQIYDRILHIKRTTRDVVLHGFPDESALLVPFGGTGLIPVSYKTLTESRIFAWNPVGESDAHEMLEACQAFDDWLTSSDPAWYAYRYAESGFEIPFASKGVERVNSWMSSHDEFEEALRLEAECRDYLSEQY